MEKHRTAAVKFPQFETSAQLRRPADPMIDHWKRR